MAPMKPKAVVAWSSGKDCSYALMSAMKSGDYDIIGLFATVTEQCQRIAMHDTRLSVIEKQSAALGLELFTAHIPWPCNNEIYQNRMDAAYCDLRRHGIEVMIFGDLFLEDIRHYRETQMTGRAITPVFPIWGRPTGALVCEMLDLGFDIRVVACDLKVLDPSFVGRQLDKQFLDDLPSNVDPCGENGEFHTVVLDMPLYKTAIPAHWGERHTRNGFAFADLITADI